ncbi:DUF4373 domain-containing protein [Sediminibacillus massiliensis]|uniref:DUF4373 domain-containing protein n=1 Tax=Sediminibacillus massiliensis TaxID=1926277 RepID=UPI00098870DA|nr:DUF4373 domain-containing protein [Sediminibacillus massiliensis]
MAKEAYYFSHDANARQDEKILMLRAEHGWEGYGIYWALVEMMFESSDSALHHQKVKGIAVSYNIDITLLESVINTCITEDLFVSDGEKFWSDSLKRRKNKYQELKEKKAEAGRKGMAKRWGNQQNNNTVISDDNNTNNTDITKNNKGKESKEKERKEKYRDYVYLTKDEYERLVSEYGQSVTDSKIEDLDTYLSNKGKNKYKDHNKTIRNWMKRDGVKTLEEQKPKEKNEDEKQHERIQELKAVKRLSRAYYEMTNEGHIYDEAVKELERLEQL